MQNILELQQHSDIVVDNLRKRSYVLDFNHLQPKAKVTDKLKERFKNKLRAGEFSYRIDETVIWISIIFENRVRANYELPCNEIFLSNNDDDVSGLK